MSTNNRHLYTSATPTATSNPYDKVTAAKHEDWQLPLLLTPLGDSPHATLGSNFSTQDRNKAVLEAESLCHYLRGVDMTLASNLSDLHELKYQYDPTLDSTRDKAVTAFIDAQLESLYTMREIIDDFRLYSGYELAAVYTSTDVLPPPYIINLDALDDLDD